jgi:hypothetical protein
MRHEPSDSCLPLQQTAGRRCPSCQAVKPPDDFTPRAGTPASCCAACRRRSAAVTRRHRQRALRQVVRRADASYRALLAQHTVQGGGDAA